MESESGGRSTDEETIRSSSQGATLSGTAEARPTETTSTLRNSNSDNITRNALPRKTSPHEQYKTSIVPRRIHIHGVGSIGKLVAHSLRGIPNPPPITLILHRPSAVEDWEYEGRRITLNTGDRREARDGFEMELVLPRAKPIEALGRNTEERIEYFGAVPNSPEYAIDNLILALKATAIVPGLLAIKNRLGPHSTICFLQNGMGIIEQVNEEVFPDVSTRPNYMLGIVSHGVFSTSPFTATHAGQGTIALGLVPRTKPAANTFSHFRTTGPPSLATTDSWAPSSRYLLRTLTRTPLLAAVGFPPAELHLLQLEKLAINCIINPLTVLLDARNGSILYNFATTRAMRLLLAEISLVFRSLPELHNIANVGQRFSPDRLETLVVGVASRTKNNISSMLADVRKGKDTEVQYINGYVVKRGEELGIKCVMNYLIMQIVEGKQQMVNREIQDSLPLVGRASGRSL